MSLRDKLVPAANFFDVATGVSHLPGPLYQTVTEYLPLIHGAMTTGMAEGALHDLIELANTGRQQLRALAPLRDSDLFQAELGRISADLRAAQAFLDAQVAGHWRHALAGTLKDDALLPGYTGRDLDRRHVYPCRRCLLYSGRQRCAL